MRSDKFKAYKLRVAGRSYNEINKLLGIPKATLSGWFSEVVLSDEATERIQQRVYHNSVAALLKRNISQTHNAQKRALEGRKSAAKEIHTILRRDLFISGVSLYWAEGYKKPKILNGKIKTSHPVSLTNSDPKLIKLFLRFIREICKVPEEKIKANLRIFEHQNEAYILDFWQKTCKLPNSQFGKVYKGISISSQRKKPYNTLPYGVVQINVSDTILFHRIMGWIDGLAQN